MPVFRVRRPVLLALVISVLAAALIGCQQMLIVSRPAGAPALTLNALVPALPQLALEAATVQRFEDPDITIARSDPEPAIVEPTVVDEATTMPAAITAGPFEEPFVAAAAAPTLEARATPVPTANTPVPVATAAPAAKPKAESEPKQQTTNAAANPPLYESGIASTYGQGDGFEGMRTGCGSIFRTQVVQVAHKTLPCGTIIRVEDTDSGKFVDAEVTDRGPYVAGRIVDLSYAAFTQLDPRGTGLLHVNVYILDTSNQYTYPLR
jgi:rare lipoprotein A (peptidoglycan hydrolase)